jgi:rhodanese-related sulfurtransferase
VTVPEVSVADLAARLDGALLVDVRQPDEYEAGHVPFARLIPLQELPERVHELPAGEEIFVICRSGSRSHVASEFLIEQGRAAVNVAGGTLAWFKSGREVVAGDQPA